METYKQSLFDNKTTRQTNYSIRSNHHQMSVESQNKLALNLFFMINFDDKRLYLNNIQSLHWDNHTQKGDCNFILCSKFIGLFYTQLTHNLTNEEIYKVWNWKEKLNQSTFSTNKKIQI